MNLSLKNKIIALASAAAFFPVIVLLIVTAVQNWRISHIITKEIDLISRGHIAQIVNDMTGLCYTANDLVQGHVDTGLRVALKILNDKGRVSTGTQRVSWEAVNQDTGEMSVIELPVVMVGNVAIEQNRNVHVPTPVVDKVRALAGGTCTLFQRINERGDMLRIATNVENRSMERAIGTFIPAVDAQGNPNMVISSVLSGNTYRGRAFVVNDWYLSAYEPLKDPDGRVIGMLYVGFKKESVHSLRKTINETVVGESGYVWVLGAKGSHRGRYIISKHGERDGENIWEQSFDGVYPAQLVIHAALALKPEEVGFVQYPWRNPGDPEVKDKMVAIRYFEPWDWVIGAGMDEDELYEVRRKTRIELNTLFLWTLFGGLFFLALAILIAFFIGDRIARPIVEIIGVIRKVAAGELFSAKTAIDDIEKPKGLNALEPDARGDTAAARDETLLLYTAVRTMTENLFALVKQVQRSGIQVTSSTTQIAASARQLEATVTEQAASSNQVAATSKQISATSRELVTTMGHVNEVAVETAEVAADGKKELLSMEGVIDQLTGAAGSISSKLSIIRNKANNIDKVLTTINKVADQTNLLSLNAAIEAEKAGEYGTGFSVVAKEIRRLADQTAVSTLDIEHTIKDMQSAVSAGVMEMDRFTEEVSKGAENIGSISIQLEKIIERVSDLQPRFENVNESMQLQSQGAQQISEAMVQLNEAIRQVSDSLKEFNTATKQLNEAAGGLQKEVAHFKVSQ